MHVFCLARNFRRVFASFYRFSFSVFFASLPPASIHYVEILVLCSVELAGWSVGSSVIEISYFREILLACSESQK